MKERNALLDVRGLSKTFYGLKALNQVDITVEKGELVSLIGPNGSGKTTLFNCVTGYLPFETGSVKYQGQDITHRSPHDIALHGLLRTFQTVKVYGTLSVEENLLLAIQQHQERSLVTRFFNSKAVRDHETAARTRAGELMEMFGLLEKGHLLAGSLSYGQRKLIAFAATLMPNPDLILLDEPAAAVNPTVINVMKDRIQGLNREGKTFLIVEHNMDVVMDISHRVVVLDHGEVIAEGSPADVQANERVLDAYFGY